MQKWEYKIIKTTPSTDEEFNRLGAEGWELVAATLNEYYGAFFIFKRPKS